MDNAQITAFIIEGVDGESSLVHSLLPASIIQSGDGEFHVIHSITLGDMMLSILIVILIVVILLSRVLGRSSKW